MSLKQQRLLREGLVGEHRDLYLNNVWFHHSLDQLARFLPYLVEGLAAHAEEEEALAQKNFQALLGAPFATPSELEISRAARLTESEAGAGTDRGET